MKRSLCILCALSLFVLAAYTVPAGSILIDDFSQGSGQSVQVLGIGSSVSVVSGLDGVLGGTREIGINVSDAASSTTVTELSVVGGNLYKDVVFGSNNQEFVAWDTGGAGLGLNMHSLESFNISYGVQEGNPLVEVRLIASAGNFYNLFKVAPSHTDTGGQGTLVFGLDQFSTTGLPTLDEINRIEVCFTDFYAFAIHSASFEDHTNSVPEGSVGPWALMLTLLVMLALKARLETRHNPIS